jgi:hypothetical protein
MKNDHRHGGACVEKNWTENQARKRKKKNKEKIRVGKRGEKFRKQRTKRKNTQKAPGHIEHSRKNK